MKGPQVDYEYRRQRELCAMRGNYFLHKILLDLRKNDRNG